MLSAYIAFVDRLLDKFRLVFRTGDACSRIRPQIAKGTLLRIKPRCSLQPKWRTVSASGSALANQYHARQTVPQPLLLQSYGDNNSHSNIGQTRQRRRLPAEPGHVVADVHLSESDHLCDGLIVS